MTTKAPPSTTGRGLSTTPIIVNNNDAIIAKKRAGQQQAFGPQVGAAAVVGAGRFVCGEVLELLPGGERPPRLMTLV